MDHERLFARIMQAVDVRAYRTPADAADPAQRAALQEVAEKLGDPTTDVEDLRAFVRQLHRDGRLDRVHMLSALGVIAAHPRVKDYAEAARLAGEQEFATLSLGGPHREHHLASVDRHRGVLAFLTGHAEIALDHFTRALERQRSAENLGNVLACLLRLGEFEEAEAIYAQVQQSVDDSTVRTLQRAIDEDPDLALLRQA